MSSFGPSVVSPTQAISQQASSSPTSQANPNAEMSIYAHQKWNSSAQQPQLYLARLPTVTPASDVNSARSLQLGVPRPKRKRITPEQLEVLSNLFEYTDTPTFDLREAIGAKLGMSNREVQVWFQNRRAKVNRQRAPSNTQATLQDRPLPSTSQQDPSRASYGRQKSSSSELLLPSVSTMLKSSTDGSSSSFPSAPLLPPFQPTVPGGNNIPDPLVRRSVHDRCQLATRPSSPLDVSGSDRLPRSELQLRSPSGSHRRNNPSTPGSPYSRKWLPRRAPDASYHDHPADPLSPRRSSTDPQPKSSIIPDHLTVHHPARPRWSSHATRSRLNSQLTSQRPQSHYLNIASMRLDQQPHADAAVNLNSYSLTRTSLPTDENPTPQLIEPPAPSSLHDVSPNQESPNESNSSSRSSSPPSHHQSVQNRAPWQSRGESMPLNAPRPVFHNKAREDGQEHNRSNNHLGCPSQQSSSSSCTQARRSCSAEEPTLATSRSLFSSRCLPPLPNPVRPGPGSFPPPVALRVVAIKRDNSPINSAFSASSSSSEFRLPPLLNERHTDHLHIPPHNLSRTK
ncbi:Mix paired-like homeobox [Puccinia graminis f. sp. tritici]|uniref:Mix paired-like homeobox n=1 Tax=Puccinia graminis f. sp. tritici TaxID=56615 RepID=A0A5B0PZ78_PUCGR|nr:Mix paired-like homeobox [Puccinia graminis f. sp. tritici]KAA1109279.1 Mix paired-like homeobox [Puccinia graminis f. sp. tritici]